MIRRPKLKNFRESTTWERYDCRGFWTFPGEYEGYDSFVMFKPECPYPLLFNKRDEQEIHIFLMTNLNTSIAYLNLKMLAGDVGLKFRKYARANAHMNLRDWLCEYLEKAWDERRREDAIFDGPDWWEKVFTL